VWSDLPARERMDFGQTSFENFFQMAKLLEVDGLRKVDPIP